MTARSLPRSALAKPRAVEAARGKATQGKAPRETAGQGKAAAAWWPWAKRGLVTAFLLTVAVLMVRYARTIEWSEVWLSVRTLPHRVIAAAAALAAVSHLLYSTFELIGKRYTGHALPSRQVVGIGLVSYAFNLNMGSMVGGVGFRLRLYSRLGLDAADAVRILSLSMVTNWLGYLTLAGLVFTFSPLDLPAGWKLEGDELRLVGIAFAVAAAGYLLLCGWSRGRNWTVRGHTFVLPHWRMALVQLALSCANWLIISATIYTLLQGKVPYVTVLGVYLIAACAGLVVRVPGGLGVLEAVFIALLSHRVPETQLLGALLAYRAIYYFVPLAIAAVLYLRMELQARRTLPTPP